MAEIEDLIQELLPDNRKEIKDFITPLLRKQKTGEGKPLRLSWAGALRRYRNTYSVPEVSGTVLVLAN